MANYETLKTAIQQVVKTNGNNEITGALLQQSLLAMINSLGMGYQFVGIATPTTNPGTIDQKIFYIANGKGTYTNFGEISITEDEVVVLYYDTAWHKVSTGIASQAKLSELEEGMCIIEEKEFSIIGRAIDTTNGVSVKQGGYEMTDFIKVEGAILLHYKGYVPSTRAAIAFYSTDDETGFISSFEGHFTLDVDVTIPTNTKYIRASSRTNDNPILSVIFPLKGIVETNRENDKVIASKMGVFFSRGRINANNKDKRFEVLENVVCTIAGVNYLVPDGTTFNFPSSPSVTLWAIVLDKNIPTFSVRMWNELKDDDVVMATCYGETKVVKFVSSAIPTSIDDMNLDTRVEKLEGNCSYIGGQIGLGKHSFFTEIYKTFSVIPSHNQGGAVFGNYFFLATNTPSLFVYNLSTGIKVAEVSLPSECHANTILFADAVQSGEAFPYLYVNEWSGDKAIRIFKISSSFSLTQVSKISVNELSTNIVGLGNKDFAIDFVMKKLYLISYKNVSSESSVNNGTIITEFNLPDITSNVVLTDNDIINHFEIPFIRYRQQCLYDYGHLYLLSGMGENDNYMYDISLSSNTIHSVVPLTQIDNSEPEVLCLDDDGNVLYMSAYSNKLYKISF